MGNIVSVASDLLAQKPECKFSLQNGITVFWGDSATYLLAFPKFLTNVEVE